MVESIIKIIDTEPDVAIIEKRFYYGELSNAMGDIISLTVGRPDFKNYSGSKLDTFLVLAEYRDKGREDGVLYYRAIQNKSVELGAVADMFNPTIINLGSSENELEFIGKVRALGMMNWDTDGV